MTDKKYRLDLGSIIDNETGHILSEVQVRNRMNKYHEENQKLLKEISDYEEVMKGLVKDNHELEEDLQRLIRTDCQKTLAYERSMHLKWKNEALHIQEQIDIAYQTERTALGKSVLKQLKEAIQ